MDYKTGKTHNPLNENDVTLDLTGYTLFPHLQCSARLGLISVPDTPLSPMCIPIELIRFWPMALAYY